MEIEAKPTEYAGVLFRSKLEATWARFFDVIEVPWKYEPTRLSGWVPDFLLDGWWLAEVKPVPVTGPWAAKHASFGKAVREFDTVLLGDGPGDAIGLVVRQMGDEIFVRSLLADLTGKTTVLQPMRVLGDVFSSHLTSMWRGIADSSDPWRPVRAALGAPALPRGIAL